MHSEWTQWDKDKSGRPNLWAAQITVQLYRQLHNTTTREQLWDVGDEVMYFTDHLWGNY